MIYYVIRKLYKIPDGVSLKNGVFMKWAGDDLKKMEGNKTAEIVLGSYIEHLKEERR